MDLSLLAQTLWHALAELLHSYLAWSRSAPRSLAERESRLQSFCQALCQLLLVSDAEADDLRVRPGRCRCGGRFQSKGRRSRTVVTTVGEVTYRRRYYECEQCRAHRLPVDEAWAVEPGCLSPRAKAWGSDLATALPFREARLWLEQLGGVPISLSTLWRVTQQAGAALVAVERARLEETEHRAGSARFLRAMRQRTSVLRPVLAVDGLYLRIARQWKEVKLAVIGQLSERGEWVKGQTSYVASTEPAERFRQLLVRHALDRGITRESVVVLLSDGADWIAALAHRFYPHARHIVDYWHAKQYLWKAAHLLWGEGSARAEAFVEEVKAALWQGDVTTLAERIEQESQRRPSPSAETLDELRKVRQYLLDRAGTLRYAEFQAAGHPVGSGAAEAGCKTLVQARMKRSGMNWSPRGAEHMLALRARYCERLAAL